MDKELQTILNYLDKIALKLNIGVQQIWPWFIKQQFINAFISLGAFLIAITINITFLTITVKFWKNMHTLPTGEIDEF